MDDRDRRNPELADTALDANSPALGTPRRSEGSEGSEGSAGPLTQPLVGGSRGTAAIDLDGSLYRMLEVLGQGGMGEVVLAFDEQIGREVAVKRIRAARPSPEEVARFVREARVQGRLEHPAVVPVHDIAVDRAGMPFFVMKRLAGTDLKELIGRLRDGREADPAGARRRMLRAFVDVCLAVEFAHSRRHGRAAAPGTVRGGRSIAAEEGVPAGAGCDLRAGHGGRPGRAVRLGTRAGRRRRGIPRGRPRPRRAEGARAPPPGRGARGARARRWRRAPAARDARGRPRAGARPDGDRGPFVVAPALVLINLMAFASHPKFGRIPIIAGILTLGVAVPWGLELAGLLEPTYRFEEGSIILSSPVLRFSEAPMQLALAAVLVTLVAITAVLLRTMARRQRAATRQIELQAWHLRQLVR